MSTTPLILAIDQSTSATKALLYTPAGDVLARASLEHKQLYPQAGWVEHDAEEIWQNTLSVIATVLNEAKGAGHAAPACLSISNQRETFVVFDRATGAPLHHAVVWQCHRGDPICDELRGAGHEPLVAERTGLKLDSYFSGAKITALLRANPELRRRVDASEAVIANIDAYLVHRLTRGEIFATDATNASRTLLFDLRTRQWDPELCRIFEVPLHALPEVRDTTARFGTIRQPGHPADGLPIAGVFGDSQAALLAHRCLRPGQAKVSIGTGSSVLLNTGENLPATGVRALMWQHQGKPTYGLEGIVNYSAATVAWLRDQLGLIADAKECEPAARSVADNGGVYLVPAFTGLSTPHWCATARAAIVGLSAASTRAHVLRAALEAIAYQIYDALDALQAEGNVKLDLLHADGGATRNAFAMQFLADILGVPVAVSENPDFSPLGAALAGGLAMGIYPSLEALGTESAAQHTFTPQMPRAQAETLLTGWHRAVKQVLAGAAC